MQKQRQPQPTDFHVDVEGIGTFRFAKRNMRAELDINVEYSRYTQGIETPTAYLDLVATWMSALKVLLVNGPAEFMDLDALDPLDDETYEKLGKVYAALRAKEQSFRRKPAPAVADGGPGDGEVGRVLVSPQVQPAAD